MASIEEANLLFKNLVTYEKSVVMAKKYVKYHKAVVEDLKRLEKLEKTINEVVIRNRATQITNCFLPSNNGEKEIINIFNEVLKSINKTLEEAMGEHMNLKEVLENE